MNNEEIKKLIATRDQLNELLEEDSGFSRVLRGGSWYNYAQFLRSANRSYDYPGYRYVLVGFRLVRTLK